MGKMKESYSNLYYSSQEDFFADLEAGENQPTYVGLLEIVRVLKLISANAKKKKAQKEEQMSFTGLAGAS
jgi:hypothetical protein